MSEIETLAKGWRPISTAPYEDEVMVRVGGRAKGFRASLRAGASLGSNEKPCDQWQAVRQGYPKCWSEGACWSSNADGYSSAPPREWKPIP